jgi:hypothetical protein
MARSIELIQNEMLQNIASNGNLTELNSTSKVAIFRLITYIVAFAIWTHEILFDTHTTENNRLLLTQKSGRLQWYRTMALQFQYGFNLVKDKDYYDNSGIDEEVIKVSKIVKYAAVSETKDLSRVIVKIAGESAGTLSPISEPQKNAFTAYIREIRWAGVNVDVINYLPDRLLINIQIKRDPLVLDNNGASILNGNNPVVEALHEFMKELPFDGELRLSAMVDKLQNIAGVQDATILSAQSSWIDPEFGNYGTPQPIFISKIPVSGYFEIINLDSIKYVV